MTHNLIAASALALVILAPMAKAENDGIGSTNNQFSNLSADCLDPATAPYTDCTVVAPPMTAHHRAAMSSRTKPHAAHRQMMPYG